MTRERERRERLKRLIQALDIVLDLSAMGLVAASICFIWTLALPAAQAMGTCALLVLTSLWLLRLFDQPGPAAVPPPDEPDPPEDD